MKISYICAPVRKLFIPILFFIMLLSACKTSTEKVLRSTDTNYKYAKAMEWYNKGAYYKAIPVFEELMGLYKGSKTTEEIYYYYCMANFNQGSYILAAYHFKNYVQKHPKSEYAQECLYMHAESFYKQSPKVNLDQTETKNAINAYQVFINTYPTSDRVDDANAKMAELRKKLEEKALKAAELYYRTKNYRAAAISYKNLTIDFPDIKGEKEIQYKIVVAYYEYAEQSVVSKQQERFEETIKEANNYLSRYGNVEYAPLVKGLLEQAHLRTIESALDHALIYMPEMRLTKLQDAREIYKYHYKSLNSDKSQENADFVLEKINFEEVKANFQLAQSKPLNKRLEFYNKTIESYNNFINQYSNSKFAREATKIESASAKNIKKIKNG